jgi:hypothetical protein
MAHSPIIHGLLPVVARQKLLTNVAGQWVLQEGLVCVFK